MDAKINEISYLFAKGENARNCLFYNRKRGSGHRRSHAKSMNNRFKIDARKRYAKSMGNYAKMNPKRRTKSLEKLKIFEKRRQKCQPKKHMIFGKVPAEIFFPPDHPK